MNTTEVMLSAGALAMLATQLIKWIYKNYIIKNPNADLPAMFYAVVTPLFSALAPFALVALGVPTESPVISMDWQGVAAFALRTVLVSLVAFISYNDGVKPLKDYRNLLKAKEERFVG